jgi:hypothetical protein
VIGYQGNWSKDFSFSLNGESMGAVNKPNVDGLCTKMLNGLNDDWATQKNPFLFSSLHPLPDDSLTLTVVYDNGYKAALFGLAILAGVLLLWVSRVRRFQILIVLIILCVSGGFIFPTWASHLSCQSGTCWAVLLVGTLWACQFVFQYSQDCRKRCSANSDTEQITEQVSQQVTEQVTTSVSTEERSGNHDN